MPDIKTQQRHRAALRQTLKKQPDNVTVRNALIKSVRPKYVQQAAAEGVFICYSMTDGIFALNLDEGLQAIGIRAFLDELEADDDMEWGDTVVQALRDCAVLLMVLSPNALDDDEVRTEYNYFKRTGKIIVPVIAEEIGENKFKTLIEPINFVDNYDIGFKKLKALLKADEKANI